MITNLTLFMSYSINHNKNYIYKRPISRYQGIVKSSFDKYLEKIPEKNKPETKFIYYVTNEESAVGKRGVLYNKDYFLTSLQFLVFKSIISIKLCSSSCSMRVLVLLKNLGVTVC